MKKRAVLCTAAIWGFMCVNSASADVTDYSSLNSAVNSYTSGTINAQGDIYLEGNLSGNSSNPAVISSDGSLNLHAASLFYENPTLSNLIIKGVHNDGDYSTYSNGVIGSGDTSLTINNVIFGGNNSGEGNSAYTGGAIKFSGDGTLTVTGSEFTGNSATKYHIGFGYLGGSGGAIYASGGNTTITDSNFTNNTAGEENVGGNGGAIDCYSGAKNLTINTTGENRNTFSGNKAYGYGGAINSFGNLNISNTDFLNNMSQKAGGAIHTTANTTITDSNFTNNIAGKEGSNFSFGGAIYFDDSTTFSKTLTINTTGENNNTFSSNKAYSSGGAIYFEGADLNISNTDFINNTAGEENRGGLGGAVYFSDYSGTKNLTINTTGENRNTFSGNKAYGSGGAICFAGATLNISNTDFINNTTGEEKGSFVSSGGAIYNLGSNEITISNSVFGGYDYDNQVSLGNSAYRFGGAIVNTNVLFITNSVFSNNTATRGGAISNSSGISSTINSSSGTATIVDTNFYNNSTTSKTLMGTYTHASGGAIQISSGKVNILAQNRDVIFQGNTADGVSNAIDLGGSNQYPAILNLNATNNSDKRIVLYDGISASGAGAVININKAGTWDTLTQKANSYTEAEPYSLEYALGQDRQASTDTALEKMVNVDQWADAKHLAGKDSELVNFNTWLTTNGYTSYDEFLAAKGNSSLYDYLSSRPLNNGIPTFAPTAGTVLLDADMSSYTTVSAPAEGTNTVNLEGGTLKLGENGTFFKDIDFNMNGGTLDLQNNKIDNISLTNMSIDESSNMKLDANFSGSGAIDNFTVANAVGGDSNLTITNINILTGGDGSTPYVTLFNGANAPDTIITPTVYSGEYTYTFTKDGGNLLVNRTGGDDTSLKGVVNATTNPRVFAAQENISVTDTLGAMGGPATTLSINGNENSIVASNAGGITTISGQTLNIDKVGKFSITDGVVNIQKAMSGFTSRIVDNSGDLNVSSSVFLSNLGGVIKNTKNTLVEGSVFKENTATSGAAVYNTSVANINSSHFISNSGTANGGAVYNDGTINIGGNTTFKANNADKGGAVYNAGIVNVDTNNGNVIFEENTSTSGGSAIYMAEGSQLNISGSGNVNLLAQQTIVSENSVATISKTGSGDLNVYSDMSGFTGAYNQTAGTLRLYEHAVMFGGTNNIQGNLALANGYRHTGSMSLQGLNTVFETGSAQAGSVNVGANTTLEIQDGVTSTLGSSVVLANAGSTLSFKNKNNQDFNSNISGNGLVAQNETGTTTLYGNNTQFEGTMQINKGNILFGNEQAKLTKNTAIELIINKGDTVNIIDTAGSVFNSKEINKIGGGELNLVNTGDINIANSINSSDGNTNISSVGAVNIGENLNVGGGTTAITGNGVTIQRDTNVVGEDTTLTLSANEINVKGSMNVNKATIKLVTPGLGLRSQVEEQYADFLLLGAKLYINDNLVFSSKFDLINSTIDTVSVGNNMVLQNGGGNFAVDINGQMGTSDSFLIGGKILSANGISLLNVDKFNLISEPIADNSDYQIFFAGQGVDPNVITTATAPEVKGLIGKYALSPSSYNNGAYTLERIGYNPEILATGVAMQAGYLTQLNTYEQGFLSMDNRMLLTRDQRQALKDYNKVASTQGGLVDSLNNQGIWARPYTTFESVGLYNAPDVSNVMYGMFAGGDSDLKELKNGWDMIWSAYGGYNGSHQAYQGNGLYQNGGTLGGSVAFYKGNFFTGLTTNIGASGVEANTLYGTDYFGMLMTGLASKTGYNWELFNGKLIIQPSFQAAYAFVNAFDYTNAADISIQTKPLNAIQIQPNLKFIANLPNNWQPYVGVGFVANLIDQAKVKANDISLPDIAVRPYMEYALGVQKKMGERFTGFAQVMLRSAGRTGVALSFGARWELGK